MEENIYADISLIRVFVLMTHRDKILNVILAFRLTNLQVDINNLREKFSPGPGFEPGSSPLRAGTLTNWATQTIRWAKLEFFSY